jgi:hypothetical protein
MKKEFIVSGLLIAVLLFANIAVVHNSAVNNEMNSQNDGTVDVDEFPKDSKQRFVAGVAQQKKLIYEQVDSSEEKEAESMALQFPNREFRYKTVDKPAGVIKGKGYSQEVHIKTEVKYVWDTARNELVSIEAFANPVTYLPAVPKSEVSTAGTFNIDKGSTTRRISQTAIFTITEKSNISVGDDIAFVKQSAGGYRLTTGAKTYAITVNADDLQQQLLFPS